MCNGRCARVVDASTVICGIGREGRIGDDEGASATVVDAAAVGGCRIVIQFGIGNGEGTSVIKCTAIAGGSSGPSNSHARYGEIATRGDVENTKVAQVSINRKRGSAKAGNG